jgi:uncharacterized repeat protein (TIGR03803 family)
MKAEALFRRAFFRDVLVFSLLTVAIILIQTDRAAGQTFSNLYNFSAVVNRTNADGAQPYDTLILSGNTLYGNTEVGGFSNGTVFAINTDGTGFTNLHNFATTSGSPATNNEGAVPFCGLTLLGNALYGVAQSGGLNGVGTMYAVTTDGLFFGDLFNFTGHSTGSSPESQLLYSSNYLYGTTLQGGSNFYGNVFRIDTAGSGYTNLHSFSTPGLGATNADGAFPFCSLILSSNLLFGTALEGGSAGNGAVFRINADGTGFTNLHSFNLGAGSTNADGAGPIAGLTLGGNTLYGTTHYAGAFASGALFRINTDGTGFTNLHNFPALVANANSDGAQPYGASLALSGSTLYGTAFAGGPFTNGTVFSINTDGTGFTVLHSFSSLVAGTNSDGASPMSVFLASNTLYGVTRLGGAFGSGSIFRLTLPTPQPILNIAVAGSNVVLSWSTNASGYSLESATSLLPPVTWNTNYPAPVLVGAQYTLTNPISGPRTFYRLIK